MTGSKAEDDKSQCKGWFPKLEVLFSGSQDCSILGVIYLRPLILYNYHDMINRTGPAYIRKVGDSNIRGR